MNSSKVIRQLAIFVAALALAPPACIVVGGYSSDRGWFIWPGTLVLLVVGVAILLLFSRRNL